MEAQLQSSTPAGDAGIKQNGSVLLHFSEYMLGGAAAA